jgi:hypothetical protein
VEGPPATSHRGNDSGTRERRRAAASFLHGITLCVDGGFSAYSGVGPLDEKK